MQYQGVHITLVKVPVFQYRKRYGLHAICTPLRGSPARRVSIPQAVWIACNLFAVFMRKIVTNQFQYRKRYGLHAIFGPTSNVSYRALFQYRKRYGLHAIRSRRAVPCQDMGFNTASGMDCMQFERSFSIERWIHVSIPQAVWIACNCRDHLRIEECAARFNTASGMDCMQFLAAFGHGGMSHGFNTASGMDCMQ